jgi:hypothetical protein
MTPEARAIRSCRNSKNLPESQVPPRPSPLAMRAEIWIELWADFRNGDERRPLPGIGRLATVDADAERA